MRLHPRAVLAMAATVLVLGTATAGAVPAPPPAAAANQALAGPITSTGTWLTDPQGRVVILHGLNQVAKTPPYEPADDGFGGDDAGFLQANGFNVMRLGVIWAAVEPTPGHYDDAYLASIKQTVTTLAAHGITSLLDFHQDLYNEKFQGEGAPAWAVQDGGLPNPSLGFPGNYFGNLAEDHAWDAFWSDAKASDGVGLQDHYAAAWGHVAAYFRHDPSVLGYEVMNEPWPGTLWEQCALPVVGCPIFDHTLTAFYQRVSTAIRANDPDHITWIEPNVVFSYVDANDLGKVADPHLGFAFHDYCPTEAELQTDLGCNLFDGVSFAVAKAYPNRQRIPTLLTEFGATNDTANIAGVQALADRSMIGWTEWAYTGNDITSASPQGQALVIDPHLPPTGSNVNAAKLKTLAEVYPQAIAGTPLAFGTTKEAFTLRYTTARAAGGVFPAGSQTDIAVPATAFPGGYRVSVSGGRVLSAPDATTLRIASGTTAATITVSVRAA